MSSFKPLLLLQLLLLSLGVYFIYSRIQLSFSLSSPPLIFRGYPSPKYQSLPTLTLSQLSQYDGNSHPKIFTSILNIVFDVTNSGFYTKQTGYQSFAGNDATLMIANWKATPELANLYNTRSYDELSEEQKNDVKVMFEGTYEKKYEAVARIWFEELEAGEGQQGQGYQEKQL